MTIDPFAPAVQLTKLLRSRKIGCLELLDFYLERVDRFNPALNAIVVMDVERARKRARSADRATSRKVSWGPLHGVPMTIKESFDVEGLPTTWGRVDMRDNIAQRNAQVVDRFLKAGAVMFGKTNVPVMLADWQTFNPVYGTTNNPWDLTRVPGGSSGGSAAALAAGLTGLEAGSDIGASIRDPAHYCGVYGHKPTFGICSPRGQALPDFQSPSDIAVVGPLARGAGDLELALKIMAGPDEFDSTAWKLRLPTPAPKTLRQFRVAVLRTADTAEVDATVQARIQAVAEFAARSGAKVSDTARPAIDLHLAHRMFIHLLRAATSRNLSDAQFETNARKSEAIDPGDDGYEAWMLKGSTLSHREWLLLHEQRHRMQSLWADFFRDYDVLLCPAATTPAFAHNQKGERWERMVMVNGKPQPSTTQMFWAGYSGMANLPSTVVPAGLTDAGLPVGVQIIGPQYGDLTCIALAKLLEKEFLGFQPPPAYV
jgi:amidase